MYLSRTAGVGPRLARFPSAWVPASSRARRRAHASAMTSDGPLRRDHLVDAHCHPHLDAHGSGLDALQPRHLALMSVSHDDWADVAAAASALGPKIVPCFGIHPWWSHLHGSHQCPDKASMFEGSEKHLSAAADVIARLPDPLPRERWEAELRDRLRADPRAVVGEVGVDRAAVLPGTRVQTKFVHQQEIMEAHLALAGEFGRPVSIHCVRAQGYMEECLRGIPADRVPPRIMLHSFGGSVEMVRRFVSIPTVGDRVYFSFNTAVKMSAATLEDKIRAVPDDRVLAESDQTSAERLEASLEDVYRVIARAKGWGLPEAVERLRANFVRFYDGFLAPAGELA